MLPEDCVIYLPTRGRVDNQITLKALPQSVLSHVIIACHPGEELLLDRDWGEESDRPVRDIIPVEAAHIGEVRDYCISHSPSDFIIFVDDSLGFHIRATSDKGTTTKYPLKGIINKHFTYRHIAQYTEDIFRWLHLRISTNRYGLAGISRRSSNAYRLDSDIVRNERVCSFWAINRKLYYALPGQPRFSDMTVKEDFYITLHFLTNGIPTITSYRHAYSREGGANSSGGCSLYRNLEVSNAAAYKLKELFPDFVSLRMKGTKSWGGEFTDKSIDVALRCGKAYEYGRKKRQSND